MSKKTLIISISIVLIVLLVALVAYYFLASSNGTGTTINIPGFKQFFPFGGNSGNENSTTTEERPVIEEPVKTPNYTQKLRKLWTEPVAGAGIVDVKAGSVVRFIERATGHIYETELFSPNQSRISNTTIPLIYNALWQSKLNYVVTEQLSENEETVNLYTYSIKTGTTTENNLSGSVLSYKVGDVSVLGDTVFYMQSSINGSVGFTSTIGSGRSTQVWNSPIREWGSQFVNKNTIALTTKPHENVYGFLYFLNPANNQYKKILGNIFGLTAIVRGDAQKVLYLNLEGNPNMYLYDVKTQKNEISIGPATFPEKCVWSKKDLNIVYCAVPEVLLNRNSLTNWYMGRISFSDDIWKYNLKDNTASLVSNLQEDGGEEIDVIKPILDDNEQYLVFINKKDNSLWSLDLLK